MNVSLSWDLFVGVFFALVVTYTFILGRSEAIKMIIATYIGIIAVQGITSALGRLNDQLGSISAYVGLGDESWILTLLKVVLFVAIVIFFTIRAGIEVKYHKEPSQLVGIILTFLFGLSTAGLMLITLMTYAAGVPLLEMKLSSVSALQPIIQQSEVLQTLIGNQDLLFTLPAVLLAAVGFSQNQS
jgi:hypothetical protein